jgi:lipopolysaccharide/colanic/teichoic acid biosynthesis glycosyltransferase
MTVLAIIFWVCVGLLLYTHAGYLGLLVVLERLGLGRRKMQLPQLAEPPSVSVIVAAYAEQEVIGERVQNLLALDYPRDRLEVIVACDGSPDETAARARAAGADRVLELPRGGKIRAQDAAVSGARGEIVAFSDANASWEPQALRRLVEPFADPRVGYVCGEVRLRGEGGTNQEGLYWRYEIAVRALESRLHSITGGNGAIYATRRESYLIVDPIMGHDLSFPFNMVKRGWLAVFAPDARSTEKMVPSIEGEFARKRRMMSHTWPIVVRGGLLSPRGYGAMYALMIVSHRVLRYASPFLHLVAFAADIALLGQGWVYVAALAAQLGVLAAAALASAVPARPLLVARYYVLTTFSLVAGLWDWLARGTSAVLTAPVVGVLALAVRLESPGHPIYTQTRIGRDGKPFKIYKLRTMVAGAEHRGAGLAINQGDDRITRVGAFLRRYSLDELPNLWNVLRGEMSIVGPRPTLAVQVQQYTERERGRLAVKPGITGWAQVNGRASLPWSERIELDLWYVEHRSLALDLRILARTFGMVVRGHGLYKGETGGWRR